MFLEPWFYSLLLMLKTLWKLKMYLEMLNGGRHISRNIRNDDEFLSRFRFCKQGVRYIIELKSHQQPGSNLQILRYSMKCKFNIYRNHAVTAQQKIYWRCHITAWGHYNEFSRVFIAQKRIKRLMFNTKMVANRY